MESSGYLDDTGNLNLQKKDSVDPIYREKLPDQPAEENTSDDGEASSASNSSVCSSLNAGSGEEDRVRKKRFKTRECLGSSLVHSSNKDILSSKVRENVIRGAPIRLKIASEDVRSEISGDLEERQRRRATKLYLKAVRYLTKMTMILEDKRIVILPKNEAPISRKFSKLILRYHRVLQKLEEYIISSKQMSDLTIPAGLLNALDENVDPWEWIEQCVLVPHHEENCRSRGILHLFGAYDATLRQLLKYGHAKELLLSCHSVMKPR